MNLPYQVVGPVKPHLFAQSGPKGNGQEPAVKVTRVVEQVSLDRRPSAVEGRTRANVDRGREDLPSDPRRQGEYDYDYE